MAHYEEKSILKTKNIADVLLKEKDMTFQDFKFKLTKNEKYSAFDFSLEVTNFDVPILRLDIDKMNRWLKEQKEPTGKFVFRVRFVNPQTNNDCASINHIIATFKDLAPDDKKHEDKGNCGVINNEYIYRRRDNYYSYTRVWKRGEIKAENYDVDLSHEFATNEYISYVKKIYGFKIIQRRTLKKEIKQAIDKACSREKKKKLYEKL